MLWQRQSAPGGLPFRQRESSRFNELAISYLEELASTSAISIPIRAFPRVSGRIFSKILGPILADPMLYVAHEATRLSRPLCVGSAAALVLARARRTRASISLARARGWFLPR